VGYRARVSSQRPSPTPPPHLRPLRPAPDRLIRDIVASYESWVIRTYSRLRFVILRQTFLEEIGQYLPERGRVLDLGCGFGLFSLFFAARAPGLRFLGVDSDARRIGYARHSASQLGIPNVEYAVADALQWRSDGPFDCIYLLDLIHHLPRARVPEFLSSLRASLRSGGTLLIKEVEDRPAWKRRFTLLLDRLMVGREPIHYWSPAELAGLLEGQGLRVVRHRMKDILPYPHILYVGRLPA
jgi:2-polyprenyl-3-methyl-5-hydroxy-6-metoxy-1,4-benzoquinol methylase